MPTRKRTSSDNIDKTYEWLRKVTDAAIQQRSAHMSFHGLEEELRDLQRALLSAYNKSKTIRHPRDMGDEREEILRHFLFESGLLPPAFGAAKMSARVVAPSGHISPELDILFFDAQRVLVLKKFRKVEFYPIECVHGTIQVKSKLTKKELNKALDNITKFKSLNPQISLTQNVAGLKISTGLHRRFGIIFAYEYDLEWGDVVQTLEDHVKVNPPEHWPNLLVILDKGLLFFGTEKELKWDIFELKVPVIHGRPNQADDVLLNFYYVLLDLLKESTAGTPEISNYSRMPLTAGPISYSFVTGAFAEIAKCPDHGDYLQRFTEKSLRQIIEVCSQTEPINWVKATDLAFGRPGDNIAAYERQPGDVRIYNPEQWPLNQILIHEDGTIAYEMIRTSGMVCLLPWVYLIRDKLIEDCPKCSRLRQRGRRSSAKP